MPPGAKVQGRQNEASKNFTTRVKSRSQARLHRRQTSSDSRPSRLVRTVVENGAKRDMGQNGSGVARGQAPGVHHLGAYQEVLLILVFRRIHADFKNYFVDYCIVMYAVRKGFKSHLTSDHKSRTKGAHKTVILYTSVST